MNVALKFCCTGKRKNQRYKMAKCAELLHHCYERLTIDGLLITNTYTTFTSGKGNPLKLLA